MTRRVAMLAVTGLLSGAGALYADTALVYVSPKNLKEHRFELTSKARKDKTVEFVITRNVRGIDGPGRAGYLSKPDDKNIGTPVKLQGEKDRLEFRFSVPEGEVQTAEFTLWGQGLRGEGVTFRFNLKDFRP